jgi:hypothetical protein
MTRSQIVEDSPGDRAAECSFEDHDFPGLKTEGNHLCLHQGIA